MSNKKIYNSTLILLGLFTLLIAIFFLPKNIVNAEKQPKMLKQIVKKQHHTVCDTPAKDRMRCHAHVVTDNSQIPLGSPSPVTGSFGPVQFHTSYNLPCTTNGPVQANCATPAVFGPQTIAIVDAYHTPNIESDLNVYSNQYNIPQCTKANGCLSVLNQNAGTLLPQIVDSGWTLETSLDVETAHAICQTCKILLIEATSNKLQDLATAVNTAANLGVTAISNSYGGSEFSSETSFDGYFNHPGTAITFSTGDSGYGKEYPATSPNVTAVGGTTLQLFTDNTYSGETVWSGTGSGCSVYEPARSWQTNLPNWSQTNCFNKRAAADVAADADPNTGASVYDSTVYNGSSGWWQVGGTSLSSPIIASVYALNGGLPANTIGTSVPYLYFTSLNSHDVQTGSNGICGNNMCQGEPGYDGPTGLGTPNGITGFATAQSSITPLPTPTLTPTPTTAPKDTTKPTISITSPTNHALAPRRSNINVSATASDNVGVTKVVFSRNGNTVCTITTGVYTCSMFTAQNSGATVNYKATAYDAAGNTAASTISVTTN